MNIVRLRQKGSVSLFVVIFATLLIIIVTAAFIRTMVQEQMQATSNDLSKSALDSAFAGVEDAKRLMVEYYANCLDSESGETKRCGDLKNVLDIDNGDWTTKCMGLTEALYPGKDAATSNGVEIKANESGADLNQSYTCLKVQMQPEDYIGSLTPSTSRIIKLQAKSGDPAKVRLEWYALESGKQANLDNGTVPYSLPQKWPDDRPPVLKAQLLQYEEEFKLADFDRGDSSTSYNRTLFLLPMLGTGSPISTGFLLDGRLSRESGSAQSVGCEKEPKTTKYACSVEVNLPPLEDSTHTRTAYLKLSQFYSAINTEFRVTMLDSTGNPLRFTNVQAAVDSTGRANDLFRRVKSRVDMGVSSVPNPESAVDVTKSLCKEFAVNDTQVIPGPHMGANKPCPALP